MSDDELDDPALLQREQNVEIVRRALEATNRGDMEEALTYIDPDGELHSAIIGGAEGKRLPWSRRLSPVVRGDRGDL